MKGILEFDLPQEDEEHITAVNAQKWKGVAWDMDCYLRAYIKNPEVGASDEYIRGLQNARNQLNQYIQTQGLELY